MAVDRRSEPGAAMLFMFRASNVRSFRDEMQLSFLATGLAKSEVVRQVQWNHSGATVDVLPAACVYGANASGKSNVLRAMSDMRDVVLRSFRSWDPSGPTERRPFRLNRHSADQPTMFEIDMVLSGVRHVYGFRFDDQSITEEWATWYPKGRPAQLFRRVGMSVTWGSSVPGAKSRAVTDILRRNALVLSTAAATGHPNLSPLYEWFRRNLLLAEADSRPMRHAFSAHMLTHSETRGKLMALLKAADLGIVGLSEEEIDPVIQERLERAVRVLSGSEDSETPADAATIAFSAYRFHHAGDGVEVTFTAGEESMGTLVWLGLAGPIVDALATGAVLLADEIDTSLHPALTAQLLRIFQDPETNPHRAQLVFNSHDTTLLGDSTGDRPLGRDQVWFAEKRSDGASVLFPLTDLDPRREEAVGRRYLAGKYGGHPILAEGDFDAAAHLITAGGK